jgi:hypothetical protein
MTNAEKLPVGGGNSALITHQGRLRGRAHRGRAHRGRARRGPGGPLMIDAEKLPVGGGNSALINGRPGWGVRWVTPPSALLRAR